MRPKTQPGSTALSHSILGCKAAFATEVDISRAGGYKERKRRARRPACRHTDLNGRRSLYHAAEEP